MKLQNKLKVGEDTTITIRLNTHFWLWIQSNYWDIEELRDENPFICELHSDLTCFGETLITMDFLKLTGNESLKEIKRKGLLLLRENRHSDYATIESIYNEINYFDYLMTRKQVKQAVNELHKMGVGNTFIFNLSIAELQGLIECIGY